jgi:hypothetical protein
MCCPERSRAEPYWALELTFSLYDSIVVQETLYRREDRFSIAATYPAPQPNQAATADATRHFAPGGAADPR